MEEISMKKLKRFSVSAIFIAICCCFLFSTSAFAASGKQNRFDRKASGNIYYYDQSGHIVKGLVTIRGKKYYFNEKGVQQNGWQKIKGNYYFFQIKNGFGAYMVTSQYVNGIYLTKNGKARYNSEGQRKLNIMVAANQVMHQVTKPSMSKSEKLWQCYMKAVNYHYGSLGNHYDYRHYPSNWDVGYAENMFYRGSGNCFAFASAFAYLANAVGYKANVVSSGGHGWAEINGKVCDPDWGKVTKQYSRYYLMDYNLSGIAGRPRYKGNRAFIVTV